MVDESTPEHQEPAGNSLRDDLAAALEASEKKMASESEESALPPESEAEPIQGEDQPTEENTAPPVDEDGIRAPQHWDADTRDEFERWPVEVRKTYLARHKAMEGKMTQATQEAAELRREYTPIKEIFAPFKTKLAASGKTEADIVREYVAIDQWLGQKPAEALKWLADRNGVDISQLTGAGHPDEDYLDPALANELKGLRQTVQSLAAQQQTSAQRQFVAQVESFAAEANSDGTPKRPYFQNVYDDMTALAQLKNAKGESWNLESLYQDAVRLNPAISAKTQEAEQKRRAEEKAVRDREAVAKAKKAAFSVKNGSERQSNVPANLRDALSVTYDKLAN